LINVDTQIANEAKLQQMADALDISREHITIDDSGSFLILGKKVGPIKSIDIRDDGEYGFFVETDTRQKFTAIETKLKGYGMIVRWKPRGDHRGYFSISRLPEGTEATTLRRLIGISKKRPASGANFSSKNG
jgi:hypothetical protein